MAETEVVPTDNTPDSPTDVTPFGSDPVPTDAQAAPAFDHEVERAKIRQEESNRIDAEYRARLNPQPAPRSDDDGLEQAIEAFDIKKAMEIQAERTKREMNAQYAPLLSRLNEDLAVRDYGADLDPEAQRYVRKYAGAMSDPQAREVLLDAARFQSIKAQGPNLNPERNSQPITGSASISDQERRMYGIGTSTGPSEGQYLKDRAEKGKDTF